MTVSRPADDTCTIHADCVIWNGLRGVDHGGTAEFLVYLCETCDNVHVSVASPELGGGLVQINAMLPQDVADRFADLLRAPKVQKWEPTQ